MIGIKPLSWGYRLSTVYGHVCPEFTLKVLHARSAEKGTVADTHH